MMNIRHLLCEAIDSNFSDDNYECDDDDDDDRDGDGMK